MRWTDPETIDFLKQNEIYQAKHLSENLPHKRAQRKMAILAPMDLDVYRLCNLKEGDAIILQNADGRLTDEILSQLETLPKTQGVTDLFLITPVEDYHLPEARYLTDENASLSFAHQAKAALLTAGTSYEEATRYISKTQQFFSYNPPSLYSLKEDWEQAIHLRDMTALPANLAIYGLYYDRATGHLEEPMLLSTLGTAPLHDPFATNLTDLLQANQKMPHLTTKMAGSPITVICSPLEKTDPRQILGLKNRPVHLIQSLTEGRLTDDALRSLLYAALQEKSQKILLLQPTNSHKDETHHQAQQKRLDKNLSQLLSLKENGLLPENSDIYAAFIDGQTGRLCPVHAEDKIIPFPSRPKAPRHDL